MLLKVAIELEGFETKEEKEAAITALNRRITDIDGFVHLNPFDKEDKHAYQIKVFKPGFDGGKEADIGIKITRKTELAFVPPDPDKTTKPVFSDS